MQPKFVLFSDLLVEILQEVQLHVVSCPSLPLSWQASTWFWLSYSVHFAGETKVIQLFFCLLPQVGWFHRARSWMHLHSHLCPPPPVQWLPGHMAAGEMVGKQKFLWYLVNVTRRWVTLGWAPESFIWFTLRSHQSLPQLPSYTLPFHCHSLLKSLNIYKREIMAEICCPSATFEKEIWLTNCFAIQRQHLGYFPPSQYVLQAIRCFGCKVFWVGSARCPLPVLMLYTMAYCWDAPPTSPCPATIHLARLNIPSLLGVGGSTD